MISSKILSRSSAGRIWIVILAAVVGGSTAVVADWSPSEKDGWRPWEPGDLLVKQGSALDFSFLVEEGPAGKHGFLKINEKGRFVFEKAPGKPVRFLSLSYPLEYWMPGTRGEIAEFAEQMRLAGYNCFRAHFLDLMLMIDTDQDLKPNPNEWDRWDILCEELQKRGIYLYVDITTTWFAFYANKERGKAWSQEARDYNLYGRMYAGDQAAREHWEKAVRLVLDHVNPYTRTALKDNPQVLIYCLRNEAGMHFLLTHENHNDRQVKIFLPKFRDWLAKKYGTVEALNKAWGTASAVSNFTDIPFPERKGTAPETVDLERFIVETEIETWHWMKSVLEKTGTPSILQDFNVGAQLAHNLSRSLLPVVDTHVYHDHPTAYISRGSEMTNESAVGQGLPFISWANDVQQLDRPMTITEWGYPYWNQYRYEAGLTAPAYGSFQGWQLLNHHSEGITLKADIALRPFKIPYEPPGKMAERMAALLFARGDVSPARHTVEVKLDPEGIFERMGGEGYLPTPIRHLTLLLRTGIRVVDFPLSKRGADIQVDASMRIHPEKPAIVWEGDTLSGETPDDALLIGALRERHLLPAGNKTDAAASIYQSDTGELTLNAKARTMMVDTPLSQAAALPAGSEAAELSTVTIRNEGESGSFFVGSIDGQPLSSSRRMLILAVGDALNSGAVFEDDTRRVLRDLGQLPVLVRTLRAVIEIRRTGRNPRLWALALNGERLREVPVKSFPDKLELHIDTGADANPVFQYELICD